MNAAVSQGGEWLGSAVLGPHGAWWVIWLNGTLSNATARLYGLVVVQN